MKFSTQEEQTRYCNLLRGDRNLQCGFIAHTGIEVTVIAPDHAEGILHVTPESKNTWDVVHGGALATLADTIGGMAAVSRGEGCVTLNYAFHFLRPANGPEIRAVANVVKRGKRLTVVRLELRNQQGELVAAGDFTFSCVSEEMQNKFDQIIGGPPPDAGGEKGL
jgi:acyl-CoA thioesterase